MKKAKRGRPKKVDQIKIEQIHSLILTGINSNQVFPLDVLTLIGDLLESPAMTMYMEIEDQVLMDAAKKILRKISEY